MKPIAAALLALATLGCGINRYSTFESATSDKSSDGVVLADDDLISLKISAVCYSGKSGKLYVSIANKSDRLMAIEKLSVRSVLLIAKKEHQVPIADITVLDHQRPAPHGGHLVPEVYDSFDSIPQMFRLIEVGPERSTERRYCFSLVYGRNSLPVEKADSIDNTIDFDIRSEFGTRHYHYLHSLKRSSHHDVWFLRNG